VWEDANRLDQLMVQSSGSMARRVLVVDGEQKR
jgi:hypothetical protein